MANIVVIFDFDCTIIDVDSDSWIINEFGITDIFKQLRSTMPWNKLMDRMMKELHTKGHSVAEIADCLKIIPLHDCACSAIREAYALGCELRVVSDANIFFIETVLKHHGILELFSKIHTNPSYVDNEGRINILPYCDSTVSPHGCYICPPNMCKGKIIEGIRTSSDQKKKFIYLGDGRGDYCPSLKLLERDHLMPRKNYPLWDIITNKTDEQKILKAEVHEWSNYEELANNLIQKINSSAFADTANMSVEND